ncbi:5'-3' exoribonuclease [Acrasis kona]|uniref:5'-3' exoribonuclease 1 n=1 Tax=Acrasis kona TaxID=1008807 RepID=A0AAW2ZJ10_9EUKA
MGVPRFFRWLVERYPSTIAPLTENSCPSIATDNLYLDMNGIIHNCTADTNEDGVRMKLGPKEVVLRVFQYIDKLFDLARPRKHFFMAIDGVAPRAKMNQQRQRRFRSGIDASQLREDLIKKGANVPDLEDCFDSNAITPGTEFMAELSRHLHYLIHKKMQDDLRWQRCNVIFSGHSVPGEGEHKIMDFIRGRKAQPGYQPNETHCLYGLDADLIMLGLAAHEPHFVLLREDVFSQYKFTSKKSEKREEVKPLKEKFHLLHLCAMREYMELEFKDLKVPFGFDLERIIDDYVFMCFFCGNDFIPHMPTLDIKEGAITTLFETYKLILPTLPGYLTSQGVIDWARVEVFVRKLGERENSILTQRAKDEKKGNNSRGKYKRTAEKERRGKVIPTLETSSRPTMPLTNVTQSIFNSTSSLTPDQLQAQIRMHEKLLNHDSGGAPLDISAVLGVGSVMDFQAPSTLDYGVDIPLSDLYGEAIIDTLEDDEELDPTNMQEEEEDDYGLSASLENGQFNFNKWHRNYYTFKFNIDFDDAVERRKVVLAYVEALTWVFNYYYQGCCSWNWFYPFHYSPIASDLIDLENVMLPPRSSHLIPAPYRQLMNDPNSPIVDFYPKGAIEIDRENTKYEWEGVVKLPFIDETKLLSAVKSIDQQLLTNDERERNAFGHNIIFKYDAQMNPYTYPSTLPGQLSDIINCKCKSFNFEMPTGKFIPALVPGVKIGNQSPEGFPTLHSRPVVSDVRYAGVNLFGMPSKVPCLVLHLDVEGYNQKLKNQQQSIQEELEAIESNHFKSNQQSAEQFVHLIGTKVYIGYPYPRLAVVSSLCDAYGSFYDSRSPKELHSNSDKEQFQKECNYHRSTLARKSGVECGDIDVLLFVKLFKGMEKLSNGSVVRQFYQDEFAYPLQLLATHYSPQIDSRFVERGVPAILQEFPLGSTLFYLGEGKHFGKQVTVESIAENKTTGPCITLKINPSQMSSPPYPQSINQYTSTKWFSFRNAADRLGIQSKTLGLLVGSIKLELPDGKLSHAIGLGMRSLKLNKRVVGYCRCEYNAQTLDESYFLNFQTGTAMDRPNSSKFNMASSSSWELSDKAIQVIQDFKNTFGEMVQLIDQSSNLKLKCEALFPSIASRIANDADLQSDARKSQQLYELKIKEISEWIKNQPYSNIPFVSAEIEMFPKKIIQEIEQASIEWASSSSLPPNQFQNNESTATIVVNTPRVLYKPGDPFPIDLNQRSNMFIGHRVISIGASGSVPMNQQGVLVAIEGETAQVVFDDEFIGGTLLDRTLQTRRGGVVPLCQLLNLTLIKYRTSSGNQQQQQRFNKFAHANQNVTSVPKMSEPVRIDPYAQLQQPSEQQQQQPRSNKKESTRRNVTEKPSTQVTNRFKSLQIKDDQQSKSSSKFVEKTEQQQPKQVENAVVASAPVVVDGDSYLKKWSPSEVFKNKQDRYRQQQKVNNAVTNVGGAPITGGRGYQKQRSDHQQQQPRLNKQKEYKGANHHKNTNANGSHQQQQIGDYVETNSGGLLVPSFVQSSNVPQQQQMYVNAPAPHHYVPPPQYGGIAPDASHFYAPPTGYQNYYGYYYPPQPQFGYQQQPPQQPPQQENKK